MRRGARAEGRQLAHPRREPSVGKVAIVIRCPSSAATKLGHTLV